jgi:hypothetical protein
VTGTRAFATDKVNVTLKDTPLELLERRNGAGRWADCAGTFRRNVHFFPIGSLPTFAVTRGRPQTQILVNGQPLRVGGV